MYYINQRYILLKLYVKWIIFAVPVLFRINQAAIIVDSVYGLHITVAQGEIENIKILSDTLSVC